MTNTKKTVAERLRDMADSMPECTWCALPLSVDLSCCENDSCRRCHEATARKLADMIEAEQAELRSQGVDLAALDLLCDKLECGDVKHRSIAEQIRKAVKGVPSWSSLKGVLSEDKRQLPEGIEWPRFEDGELVNFGDEIQHDGEAKEVSKVSFYKTRTWIRVATETYYEDCEYLPNEPFKRPESEVLDADGVPIKVGDTVYHEVDGSELTVVGFRDEKEDGEVMVDVEGKWFCVRQFSLTHRKPDTQEAINADLEEAFRLAGEQVGDTIWLNDTETLLDRVEFILERQRKLLGGE